MSTKDVEWFQTKIKEYPSSKEHNVELVEFINELKKLSRDGRKNIASQLRFEPMFDLVIKWNNPVYADPFYDLLVMIFEVTKASDVIAIFEPYLRVFIDHVSAKFQDLVFSILGRVVSDGDLETLTTHKDLTLEAAKVLSDRDLEKATPCLKFLTDLAHVVPHGTQIVFSGPIGEVLRSYAERNSVLLFRIYELVTDVACISPEALNLMCQSGLLQDLHDSIVGPSAHVDQLGFVNSVEIYKRLSQTPHCYDFLVSSGVVAKLQERILEYGPGGMEDKVMPTLYEFFGSMCAKNPENVFRDAPDVVPRLLYLAAIDLEHTDSSLINRASMIMLGQVASTLKGKLYLHNHKNLMDAVLNRAADFLKNGNQDDKTAVIDFVEALIFNKPDEQTPEALDVTHKWFLATFKTMKALWEMAKHPTEDLALPAIQVFELETSSIYVKALSLMAVVSQSSWGRKMIIEDTPGLTEWLMDRQAACGVHPITGSGANPEMLRAKFAVVQNIMKFETSNFPDELKAKIQDFIKEGPLYVKGAYDVAMEGGES